MPIRVASYNIRKSVGRDYRRDPMRVLDVLNEIDADVVALQEADRRFGGRPTSIPRELIAQYTDFNVADLSGSAEGIGWHGNAVLVRKPHVILATKKLTLPGLEPRGAVVTDFMLGTQTMRVVGVHLGLLKRNRRRQISAILDALAEPDQMPTVLMGDFNEWSKSGRNLTALFNAFDVHSPGHSFPSGRPVAGLDRIATSKGITLIGSGVQQCENAKIASDHLPIWADIAAV